MNYLKYIDEIDKSYGLTGMVLSLNIWDKHDMLRSITLDNTADEDSICFNPEYCFNGNPRMSAKITWNEMLSQYQLLTGMIVGNMLCRSIVHDHKQLSRNTIAQIHSLIEEEGRSACSLDDDEIDAIFNKTFNYLTSLYANRQISAIAERFASILRERRTMSGNEVEEQIEILRRY